MNDIYTIEGMADDGVYKILYLDRSLEYPSGQYIGTHPGFDLVAVLQQKRIRIINTRLTNLKPGDQLSIRPLTRQQAEGKVAVLCKGCGLKEWYKLSDTIKMCSKCGGSEFVLESEINKGLQSVLRTQIADAGKVMEQALRYNEGKTRWSLVHFPSLEPMVEVLEYGAKKYDQDNWKKPMDKKQILNSMMRHLVRLMEDEELDSESNLKHIGHIMCNALFYSYHSNQK